MAAERFIITADGTRLYSRALGQGPCVVLCDGLGCDGFIWKYLEPALAENFRVVHWHYRGHGHSARPKHPDAVGISALRSDLHHVMANWGIGRAVLMGHSMGVQLALEAALTWPKRIMGLVLMCGSYGHPLDTLHDNGRLGRLFPALRFMMLRYPRHGQKLWQTILGSEIAFRFARQFEVNGPKVLSDDFRPYFQHLRGMNVEVFVRMLTRLQKHSTGPRLKDVDAPTLIIGGERDTFTPLRLSHTMARNIANSELFVVPSGSHVAPIERPEAVTGRILNFLQRRVISPGVDAAPKGASTKSAPA